MIKVGLPLMSATLLAVSQGYHRCVIVTDSTVLTHYGHALQQWLAQQDIRTLLLHFPAGEAHKTRTTKAELEDSMLAAGCGRDTLLIALGGGVVTDLAGFIAATYMRGIDCVLLPTTLMAMVDASIGGKTAVNTPHGKNAIGAFLHPKAVLIDPQTLATLPENHRQYGLSEVIKHALLAGETAVADLEANLTAIQAGDLSTFEKLIADSVAFKQRCVTTDYQEQHRRQILNLGHTLAHALEAASGYHIPHGQAVGWGLKIEASIAVNKLGLPQRVKQRIHDLVDALVPQPRIPYDWLPAIAQAITTDKKNRNGCVRLVLLKDLGQVAMDGQQYTQAVSTEDILTHCQHGIQQPQPC